MHVLGTAGHVDHGKSTLVRRLTGIDPDRFAEEKRRGLTIDLGFAWLELPSGNEIGIVDVPGHERFIKNMLAGAGGVSTCLFVVAANEGWKPQSAEHLAILDVLNVTQGVVALTKSDTVEPDLVTQIADEIAARLSVSSLAGSPVVPCSAVTGDGMEELIGAIDRMVGQAPVPQDMDRPRLWIDRVFTIAGAGTVVTGTLAGGGLSTGEEVEISPEGRRARVRSIQSHKKKLETVEPGNRVALNLAGLERQGAERGDAVVKVRTFQPTTRIDARIRVLSPEITGQHHELTEKGAHLLYAGSAETPVKVRLLDRKKIEAGGSGFAQLVLRDPLPLARGDRFVLRDAGRVLTFGGGEVLDPLPERARGDVAAHIALLERVERASADEALGALVDAAGVIKIEEALIRSGATEVGHPPTVLGNLVVSTAYLDTLRARLNERLTEYHGAHPLENGMPRELLRAALDLDPEAFDGLLRASDGIVSEGTRVRAASHSVALDPAQRRARDDLLSQIERAGFNPPFAKELQVAPELLHSLTQSGELVKIDGFYLTRSQADDARARVRSAIGSGDGLTVAEIRDLLGTSRKYAVPLCEWLDATGATVRRGDVRVLGPNP